MHLATKVARDIPRECVGSTISKCEESKATALRQEGVLYKIFGRIHIILSYLFVAAGASRRQVCCTEGKLRACEEPVGLSIRTMFLPLPKMASGQEREELRVVRHVQRANSLFG